MSPLMRWGVSAEFRQQESPPEDVVFKVVALLFVSVESEDRKGSPLSWPAERYAAPGFADYRLLRFFRLL